MRFKSKYIVFLLVVCILFSAAAVSASDATYMDVNADDSNEKLELTNYKTYDNLYEDIESSTDSFDMENDYKYDESDSRMDLSIIDYHVNYQTDLTGLCGFDGKYTTYSNEFTSKYTESIGAVGTYFNESGIDYSFDVYVNGEKVHTQSGISEFAGFRTIILNEYVQVKSNDTFKVVFKSNALPYQAYSRQHYIPGMSRVSEDGETWSDITLENRTVCLKVYTVADDKKDNDTDDDPTPSPDIKPTPVPDAKPDSNKKIPAKYNSNAANHAYTVYRASDMKVICHSKVINLFKLNMTNGHLKVYIDGTLVFDGDVDDDLSKVIIEIIEKLLGMHEITVEFTDKSGKTETLNETIIIE